MTNQEMNLLMPGNQVPWWPRQGWEPWVQPRGNNMELARGLDTKLDVTPESNGTSISENRYFSLLRLTLVHVIGVVFMYSAKWLQKAHPSGNVL
ncbi:unnamed protein product [Heterotrigona itama]|uniref:Uncharacterized protein n=1 Tax=Heterotrigona itama TaxID=395501 RepID=A0A6V7H1A3_9HYME|nr:unnamed protein product [Heterotrigona itama]